MTTTYVFVINSLLPGGAERSLVELLPRLRESGVRPVVVALHRREVSLEDEVRAGGFELRVIEASTWVGRLRAVRQVIRSERPSLVHTTLFDADVVGRLAATGIDVAVMSTLANTTYDADRLATDENLSRAKVEMVRLIDGFTARRMTDHFHAVSQAVKDSAVAMLGIDDSKVTVVHRGRDPQRLGARSPVRREATRRLLEIDEDTKMVLTVGRGEFQKGHDHLARAFATLLSDHPNAVLAIAGREGNATDRVVSLIDELGISDRVMMLGHRSDVADLMSAADVFAFPSLWEGLGGALIEALALEVPIVASDIPAIAEVVVPDRNALLVAPGDEAALAAALSEVLGNPAVAARLTADNRSRFESMFDLDQTVASMIELLATVAR